VNDDKYAKLRELMAKATPTFYDQAKAEIIHALPTLLADLDAATRERDDLKDNALSLALWKRDWHEKCVMAERERDALRTENARLREALEPFAKMGDTRFVGSAWEGKPDVPIIFHSATGVGVTPSDFYLARTTLGGKQ
jgi:hypothetical protein